MHRPTLLLAPIRGVTDDFFRRTFAEVFGGFDGAVAPFFRAYGEEVEQKELRDLQGGYDDAFPVVPQILTKRGDAFASAAKALEALGYRELNWNLGCPHAQVVKRGLGAGLVAKPEVVEGVLDKAFAETKMKISIKARLGLEDPTEFGAVLPVLNRYPLARVVIHPRTAAQMYGGEVLLDAFEDCLRETSHEVVYNGDIRTVDDFARCAERFNGISTWMIGRGALADPLLAERVKGVTTHTEDLPERLTNFHRRLYEHYRAKLSGDAHLLSKMKTIWEYMAPAVPNARFAKKIKRAKSLYAYDGYILEFLEETTMD